jgi:hypothetical protein
MFRMLSVLGSLALVACGGPSVDGDDEPVRLGGQVSSKDAATLQIVDCAPGEAPVVVSTVEVHGDGGFELEVPARLTRFALRAVDADGRATGALLVNHAGDDTVIGAFTAESTVEAETWLLAQAGADNEVSTVDVSAWIDGRLSLVVEGASDRGEALAELALAVRTAAATEAQAWSEAGLAWSADGLTHAKAAAAARAAASLALMTSETDRTDAMAAVFLEAAAAMGATPDEAARAHAASALAFEAAIRSAGAEGQVGDSAVLAAWRLQAAVTGRASVVLVAEITASAEARAAAVDAAARLRARVHAAGDVRAAGDAFEAFRAEFIGDGDVDGSVLDLALRFNAVVELAVELAIDVAVASDAAVDTAVQAWLERRTTFEADAVAREIADAQAEAQLGVEAAFSVVTLLAADDAEHAAALVFLSGGSGCATP